MATQLNSRIASYVHSCLRYYSGQSKNAYPPGGFAYGLDQPVALAIEEAIYSFLQSIGQAKRPLWRPKTEYSERRLAEAYHKRGLIGVGDAPPAGPQSIS